MKKKEFLKLLEEELERVEMKYGSDLQPIKKMREEVINNLHLTELSGYVNEDTGKPSAYHQPKGTVKWGSSVGWDRIYFIKVE